MLSQKLIEDILIAALSTGGDFAEVFVEDKHVTAIDMIGGKIERANSGHDFGVGVRIFDGTNSVYAYSNDPGRDNLIRLAKEAAVSIAGVSKVQGVRLVKGAVQRVHTIRKYPADILKGDKVALLKRGYEAAKNYDDVISQVTGYYLDSDQNILIANSEGLMKEDRRIRTRCGISAVAH